MFQYWGYDERDVDDVLVDVSELTAEWEPRLSSELVRPPMAGLETPCSHDA